MNYYEQDDRRGRMWGIIGVVLYVALCVGVMFITYRIALPEPELGILVDFGTGDTGSGEDDLALSEQDTRPVAPRQQNTQTETVMTSDEPDTPAIISEPRPVTEPARPVEQPTPQREVDRRALFPGRTEGSTSASQGTAGGEGNQGTQEGAPNGSDSAGGSGSSGFSLAGRYLVGNLPRPAYAADAEGRVVIRITVDRDGTVKSATYEQAGSTTNHGDLVSAARTAAMRARFTASDAEIQTGTITYIFKLN